METINDLIKKASRKDLERLVKKACRKLPELEQELRLTYQSTSDNAAFLKQKEDQLFDSTLEQLKKDLFKFERKNYTSWEAHDEAIIRQYRKAFRKVATEMKKLLKEAIKQKDDFLFIDLIWKAQEFVESLNPKDSDLDEYVDEDRPNLSKLLEELDSSLSDTQKAAAFEWASKKIEEDPEAFEPFKNWYYTYFNNVDQLDHQLADLEKRWQKDALDSEELEVLLGLFQQKNETGKIDQLLRENKDNRFLYFQQADWLAHKGEIQKAIDLLEFFNSQFKHNDSFSFEKIESERHLAKLYLEADEREKARALYFEFALAPYISQDHNKDLETLKLLSTPAQWSQFIDAFVKRHPGEYMRIARLYADNQFWEHLIDLIDNKFREGLYLAVMDLLNEYTTFFPEKYREKLDHYWIDMAEKLAFEVRDNHGYMECAYYLRRAYDIESTREQAERLIVRIRTERRRARNFIRELDEYSLPDLVSA